MKRVKITSQDVIVFSIVVTIMLIALMSLVLTQANAQTSTVKGRACVVSSTGVIRSGTLVYDKTPTCRPGEFVIEFDVAKQGGPVPTTTSTTFAPTTSTTKATTTTSTSSTTTSTSTTTTTQAPTTTTTQAPPIQLNSYPDRGSVGAFGTLTDVYPGAAGMQIRTPTTVSNVRVHGGIDCYSVCTLRNVSIENSGEWWGNVVIRKGGSVNVDGCTVSPDPTKNIDARLQDAFLNQSDVPSIIKNCDISYAGKGSLSQSNVTFEHNWVHCLTPYVPPTTGSPTHKGGFMTMGGTNIVIRNNRLEANNDKAFDIVSNPCGFDPKTQTGAILLQPWGDISNVTIEGNFLMGGYYSLRMENTQTARGINGSTSHLIVQNNVWGPWPSGGGAYVYQDGVGIDTWAGNVRGDADGIPSTTPIGRPTGS